MSAADIRDFYLHLAPRVFRRGWRVVGLQTAFDAKALEREIKAIVSERTLDTPDLRTGLAIVTKRMDTGSVWIVTNSQRSRYWEDSADNSHIGNRRYRLSALLRATTAAPYYFTPESIAITQGRPPGLFIDGAVSPHNNPALAMLQVATIPAMGSAGRPVDNLHSCLSGGNRERGELHAGRRMAAGLGYSRADRHDHGRRRLMTDTLRQPIRRGRSTPRSAILLACCAAGAAVHLPAVHVRLERQWLRDELGLSLSDRSLENLARIDRADVIPLAYEIGQAAAEKFVRPEHLA